LIFFCVVQVRDNASTTSLYSSSDLLDYVAQGSPTFLKLRATSCVPINAKGY